MWYGVFLWAAVSSLVFHLPAALLSLASLRQHKFARFMPVAILLMGIVGPVFGGVLTSKPSTYTCCIVVFLNVCIFEFFKMNDITICDYIYFSIY